MKKKILTILFATSLALTACGGDSQPSENSSAQEVEETDQNQDTEENVESTEDIKYDFNEVLVDDESLLVELDNIQRVYDDLEGDVIGVFFDVENKTDRTLEVQARSVSINDRMVDDSLIMMSQEVAPGKSAEALMMIRSYDKNIPIPELEGNLEMELHIFDWDDYDYEKDIDVYVEF